MPAAGWDQDLQQSDMSDRAGRRGVRLEGFEHHPFLCMDLFQKDSPTCPLHAAARRPSTIPAVELKLEFEVGKSKVASSPKNSLGADGESWLMDGTCRVHRMSR